MAYSANIHTQDLKTGRVFEVLDAIDSTAAGAGTFVASDAAVAYATLGGVRLLTGRLCVNPSWNLATKRWLVSIDFGTTQPAALEALSKVPQSEVRIPNGLEVAASRRFMPPSTFHPKGYLFRGFGWGTSSGLIVGSANLTVSALATGSEVMSSQVWRGPLSGADRKLLNQVRAFLAWYEDVWDAADSLSSVLPTYTARRLKEKWPPLPPEDETSLAKAAAAAAEKADKEVHGELELQLRSAQAIWFETGHLYENRGSGKPGNQLDTPRGTRVFFGFDSKTVGKNTILGMVGIRVAGHAAVERSVRFANNYMDKVNLPVPSKGGVLSYDNSILIFERDGSAGGRNQFCLTLTDEEGLRARKAAASNAIDLSMQSGRPYGLLF